jgi:hypothetical protein
MNNRHAHQTNNAHTDPLRRQVQQVGSDRQADDQDNVPHDIDPERHCFPPLFLFACRTWTEHFNTAFSPAMSNTREESPSVRRHTYLDAVRAQ